MKLIGFYQEMDPHYAELWGGSAPAPESGAGQYPVQSVVEYLRSGYPVLDVMELTTDVIGGAFRVPGGSSILTNGEYVWREDLAWYVDRYHIELPPDFLETARRHEFRTPSLAHETLLGISTEVSRLLGFQPKP